MTTILFAALVGFIVGYVCGAASEESLYLKRAKKGFIVLDNDFYRLEKVDFVEESKDEVL